MAKRISHVVAAGLVLALVGAASMSRAHAQGNADESVDTIVARSLVDRGMTLFRAQDYANAKQLFVEAVERDPRGPYTKSALEMVRKSNAKLGLRVDDGVPAVPAPGDEGLGVEDPYGAGGDGDLGVEDPYGGTGGNSGDGLGVEDPYGSNSGNSGTGDLGVEDPYGGTGEATPTPGPVDLPEDADERERARKELMVFGGGYGFLMGLGLAGDDEGAGGAALLGAAAGVGIAHFATKKRNISLGDAMAVETAGVWGASTFGFIGHIASGDDELTGPTLAGWSAAGASVGLAAGYLWASKEDPKPGDIAVVNSFAAYGTGSGLLLGLALPPAKAEAFSVNALVGGVAGTAAALRWGKELQPTRERMWKIDLGAAVGAGAPWVLLYPLIEDDTTNNDEQVVGFLSLAGLGGGAYLAYRWTRGDAAKADKAGEEKLVDLGPPALARRASDGTWALGMPLPRPVENPALAPPTGAFNIGLDLFGGRF